MEMGVENIVLHVGPKSSIGVKLGWDLVSAEAVTFYSRHFHTHQTSETWCTAVRNSAVMHLGLHGMVDFLTLTSARVLVLCRLTDMSLSVYDFQSMTCLS